MIRTYLRDFKRIWGCYKQIVYKQMSKARNQATNELSLCFTRRRKCYAKYYQKLRKYHTLSICAQLGTNITLAIQTFFVSGTSTIMSQRRDFVLLRTAHRKLANLLPRLILLSQQHFLQLFEIFYTDLYFKIMNFFKDISIIFLQATQLHLIQCMYISFATPILRLLQISLRILNSLQKSSTLHQIAVLLLECVVG